MHLKFCFQFFEAVAGMVASVGMVATKTSNLKYDADGTKKYTHGRGDDNKVDLMLKTNEKENCLSKKTKLLIERDYGREQYEKLLVKKSFGKAYYLYGN